MNFNHPDHDASTSALLAACYDPSVADDDATRSATHVAISAIVDFSHLWSSPLLDDVPDDLSDPARAAYEREHPNLYDFVADAMNDSAYDASVAENAALLILYVFDLVNDLT